MDPRLLDIYSQELKFIREQGVEFAQQFPKVASRLNLESFDVVDPYVERLLEGFAFLAARTQLKIQSEYPRLSDALLEQIYPHILAPRPSMGVVTFDPDYANPALASCPVIPRGELLMSHAPRGGATRCTFSVGHNVTLAPVKIDSVTHGTQLSDLPQVGTADRFKSVLRVKLLITQPDLSWSDLPLESLDFYVGGADEFAYRLVERIFSDRALVFVAGDDRSWHRLVDESISPIGFDQSESLLPQLPQSVQGFRIIQEYFALSHRFNFFRLSNLSGVLKRLKGTTLEFVVGFKTIDANLDRQISSESLRLFAAPVINIFSKECDRVDLTEQKHEYHLVVDRTKPMDYEYFASQKVRGYGQGSKAFIDYLPMNYFGSDINQPNSRFYSVRRDPRLPSTQQKLEGGRTKHLGQEAFISLSSLDVSDSQDLKVEQLAVKAWVTNRDLPLIIPVGQGETDLVSQGSLPVLSIRFQRGPTRPRTRVRDGRSMWRFIQHCALNYRSFFDAESEDESALAIRQMLTLFIEEDESALHKQVHGIRRVRVEPSVSRVSGSERIAFARGLKVILDLDVFDFQGAGLYIFGSVLNELLRRHVSVNSFIQLRIEKAGQEGFFEWSPVCGSRPLI